MRLSILFALGIGAMLSCKKPPKSNDRHESGWRGIPAGMATTCGAWKDGVATCITDDGSMFVCVDGRETQGCDTTGDVACSRRSPAAPPEYAL